MDRRHPSPPEWTFITKFTYRSAKSQEEPNEETGLVDWTCIGDLYRQIIERLEDPAIDGAGLQPILKEEGDIYIDGVGKAGLDISAKSEPWRRGYYQCLMDLAKAAENRDGWLLDTMSLEAFAPQSVVGPSNPAPIPLGPGSPAAPLEENCIPVFDPPATYYMKILTTSGFTSWQRLNAALAFADWLDFKGLSSTAEDMYDWGLDIAMGALPLGANNVVDIKTGIINGNTQHVSSNILSATTALAAHHARNNNLAAALPIFLSVLRARKQLSESSPPPATIKQPTGVWSDLASFIRSVLAARPFPPPPPSGDEVPTRTPVAICEEAAIMSNIGEILFSTTRLFGKDDAEIPSGNSIPTITATGHLKSRQAGLSWTREAVDVAEATLVAATADDAETRKKCTECLAVSMENWSTMVEQMLKDEQDAKVLPKKHAQSSWFWGSGATADKGRWERESAIVDERLRSIRRLLLNDEQRKQGKTFLATFLGD